MKKTGLFLLVNLSLASLLSGCKSDENVIKVGASPSPHATILNSDIVNSYIESKGYKLEVVIYQDYITPNKALNDEGIDANYFQHTPYLLEEVETKGYDLKVACEVHYEPLNIYSKTSISDLTNKKISIINDVSNIERALALLEANNYIESYTMEGFNVQNPNDYVTNSKVTLECLDPGLLANKVNDDGIAIIPGNYALNAWGAEKATDYKILGETKEVAAQKANIIAARTNNVNSEKINILCEALAQEELNNFLVNNYGPTVVYSYKDVREIEESIHK